MGPTAETLEKVSEIFAEKLKERFDGEFIFGPIVVKPAIGPYIDDEIVRVLIVLDGDVRQLDPDFSLSLPILVSSQLQELGIENYPSLYFIEKSEWDYYERRGKLDVL